MNNKGLIHIYTGDGKGKTTAAIGLCVRAVGAGRRVLFAQFLKGWTTGEIEPLKTLGVHVVRSAQVLKFIPEMNETELEDCRRGQSAILDEVESCMSAFDFIILDEALGALSTGIVSLEAIRAIIKKKPESAELVLTGRNAPEQLVELADYVSEIKAVKHPYDRGISARRGIEF